MQQPRRCETVVVAVAIAVAVAAVEAARSVALVCCLCDGFTKALSSRLMVLRAVVCAVFFVYIAAHINTTQLVSCA
jgi:hypothetical protein